MIMIELVIDPQGELKQPKEKRGEMLTQNMVDKRNYYITQHLLLFYLSPKEDDSRVSPKQYPEFGQE